MKHPIYLDHNATTPLDEEVLKVMLEEAKLPLNPSSVHSYGMRAKSLLSSAREQIAACLDIHPEELIFTSGGTESLNMLIPGLYRGSGTILTSSIEHAAVYEPISALKKEGIPVSYIPVDAWGAPTLKQIEEYLLENHLQDPISLMVFSAVYSETGVKLDLNGVAALALHYKIPLIIDGVALLGKELFAIPEGISGMGFSAHKLHGPKGVGAAYLSSSAQFHPLSYGGHQEKGLRPGTEPLGLIMGFAKAVQLAYQALPASNAYMASLQSHFEQTLKSSLPDIEINGAGPRVCTTSNIYFHGMDGETLLLALDRSGVYASMGSACSSGAIEPSRVLLNMGFNRSRAKSSLRFSFSRNTTLEELNEALLLLINISKRALCTF